MNTKNNTKFQATWVDMMTHGNATELQKRAYDTVRQAKLLELKEKQEFAKNLRWLKENSEIDYFRLRNIFAFRVTKNSSYIKYRTKTVVEGLKTPQRAFRRFADACYGLYAPSDFYYDSLYLY